MLKLLLYWYSSGPVSGSEGGAYEAISMSDIATASIAREIQLLQNFCKKFDKLSLVVHIVLIIVMEEAMSDEMKPCPSSTVSHYMAGGQRFSVVKIRLKSGSSLAQIRRSDGDESRIVQDISLQTTEKDVLAAIRKHSGAKMVTLL
jgi:hypothetical protein